MPGIGGFGGGLSSFSCSEDIEMYERYSASARCSLAIANQEAIDSKCKKISARHLLIGIIQTGRNAVVDAMESMDALQALKAELGVTRQFAFVRPIQEARVPMDDHLKRIVEQAISEARMSGHEFVTTAHLVLAMLRLEGEKVMALAGLTYDHSAAIPRLSTSGGDPEPHPS